MKKLDVTPLFLLGLASAFLGDPEPGVAHADFGSSFVLGLVMSAILIVISELIRPKPEFENAKPGDDFNFPTAVEGRPTPIGIGTNKISGPNVVWWGDRRDIPIREKMKTGLWSSRRVTVGYRYKVGIQMALLRGALNTLTKIWVGDKELWSGSITHEQTIIIDEKGFFGGDERGNGGLVGTVRFHDGRDDQAVNTYISGFQTPTSAYRGTGYVALENFYIGNSTNVKPWAFECSRFPRNVLDLGLSGYTAGNHIINTVDGNPIEWMYELATSNDWGYGYLPSEVEAQTFADSAETCADENNGISMTLDRTIELDELKRIIEQQVDGVMVVNRRTGKLEMRLARDDYVVGNLDPIDDSNRVELQDFARQTWVNTANQVRITYVDRSRNYFSTYAQSHDLANQRMQGGQIVPATINMPGVKDADLANAIAARELRFLSYPLARATVVVDRSFWDTSIADVFRFSDSRLGITDLPMRVTRVDYGDFIRGRVTLNLIQDVFSTETGFFGTQDTSWVPPTQGVATPPADELVVIEAPKKIIDKDPDQENAGKRHRILVAGRQQAAESSWKIYQRNETAPTAPSGSYVEDGEVFGLILIGQLNVAVDSEDVSPITTMQISGSPDSASLISDEFVDGAASATQVGQDLAYLILVDDEFMGVSSVGVPAGNNIDFQTVYRGMLDSVRADHSVGADVYLLFVGSGLNGSDIPAGQIVDVQPRGVADTELAEGSSTTVQITMDSRYERPYAPGQMTLNTVLMDPSLDINGGLDVVLVRRDFLAVDEVPQLTTDAGTLDSTYPAKNSTEHRVRILDGSVVLVATDWQTSNSFTIDRGTILKKTNGVLTSPVNVNAGSRHTFESVVYESRVELSQESTVVDAELTGLANIGTLGANAIGAYAVSDETVDHNFRLEGGTLAADVEYRINTGGAWTQLIASGMTTGSIPNASIPASATIFIRHLDNADGGKDRMLFGAEDGAPDTDVLYGVLTDDGELDSLMGYWNMDESSGGTVQVDRAPGLGSRSDLTDQNTTSSQPGKTGFGNSARCRDNASTQEYLELPYAAYVDLQLDYSTDWTISCWVYHESGTIGTGGDHFHGFVFRGVWPGGAPSISDRSFVLGWSNGTGYGIITYYGTGTQDARVNSGAPGDAPTEQWVHLCATYDSGSGTLELYVDGVSEGTDTSSGTMNQVATNEPMLVGAVNTGTLGSQIDTSLSCEDTRIDEVRIYHRELSLSEVEALRDATQPV